MLAGAFALFFDALVGIVADAAGLTDDEIGSGRVFVFGIFHRLGQSATSGEQTLGTFFQLPGMVTAGSNQLLL